MFNQKKSLLIKDLNIPMIENYLDFKKSINAKGYFLKRPFDIALSLGGIILFFPVSVIIAFAIWLEDRTPVLYMQERTGQHGKVFKLYKFRSMVKEAELNTGAVLAKVQDERVTNVGRFLRKTALDELPQLINILKGDLSFVGPRPERPEIVKDIAKIHPDFELRHVVKPGLTGMAQVYGNYDTGPYKKLKYDLFYIEKASFLLDLKLIYKSIIITIKCAWNLRSKRKRGIFSRITKKIKKQIR